MKKPDAFKAFYRKTEKKQEDPAPDFRRDKKTGGRPPRPAWKKDHPGTDKSLPAEKGQYPALKMPTKGSEFPLNKYIAHCGICSRRKAVDYIKQGDVTVNGEKIIEPGFKVSTQDKITLNGKKLHIQQEPVYLLMNKPKDCLSTTKDPQGRRTVMDLIRNATTERVYPVGRLDRNTSGLLLFTNDGELAQKLSHPGCQIKKVYHVTLDKPLTVEDFDVILKGVTLEDGVMRADAMAYVEEKDKTQIGLEIHSGRNRIVRRTFEHLGYKVKSLDRVLYAGLTKKNIPRGKWRILDEKEVRLLKHFTPKKIK